MVQHLRDCFFKSFLFLSSFFTFASWGSESSFCELPFLRPLHAFEKAFDRTIETELETQEVQSLQESPWSQIKPQELEHAFNEGRLKNAEVAFAYSFKNYQGREKETYLVRGRIVNIKTYLPQENRTNSEQFIALDVGAAELKYFRLDRFYVPDSLWINLNLGRPLLGLDQISSWSTSMKALKASPEKKEDYHFRLWEQSKPALLADFIKKTHILRLEQLDLAWKDIDISERGAFAALLDPISNFVTENKIQITYWEGDGENLTVKTVYGDLDNYGVNEEGIWYFVNDESEEKQNHAGAKELLSINRKQVLSFKFYSNTKDFRETQPDVEAEREGTWVDQNTEAKADSEEELFERGSRIFLSYNLEPSSEDVDVLVARDEEEALRKAKDQEAISIKIVYARFLDVFEAKSEKFYYVQVLKEMGVGGKLKRASYKMVIRASQVNEIRLADY